MRLPSRESPWNPAGAGTAGMREAMAPDCSEDACSVPMAASRVASGKITGTDLFKMNKPSEVLYCSIFRSVVRSACSFLAHFARSSGAVFHCETVML